MHRHDAGKGLRTGMGQLPLMRTEENFRIGCPSSASRENEGEDVQGEGPGSGGWGRRK